MIGESLDKLISVVSPKWAASRAAHRQAFQVSSAHAQQHRSMQKLFSAGSGGYEAGKHDRLKGYLTNGSYRENAIPREQIDVLRWRSWMLYRNCAQARKIIRNLKSKVVGRGLIPQPQSVRVDGTPHVEFRKRARTIWKQWCLECDYRGKPGFGGATFAQNCKTGLQNVVLSGGLLFRFHVMTVAEQRKRGLSLPLTIQFMHVDCLDRSKHGGADWNGLKLDDEGRVVGYYVLKGGVDALNSAQTESVFVSAADMGHLFAEEDIDQLLGAPWMGATLVTADDRRSYEHSELVSAEMGACFVAGYRRGTGQGPFGLQGDQAADGAFTDPAGNPIMRLQPGMFLNLGRDGAFETINPARPNPNAEGFINHLVRGEAVAMPGTKSSTLTGDYRQSSFSSERSADNDTWPEIEELQDWLAFGLCNRVYETVITTAVLMGLFDDIEGFTKQDFIQRRSDYLEANWQGPVARSINPRDDAGAADLRIKARISSIQREAAQVGRDWRELVQEHDEFIDYCNELGLPEEFWQEALGIKPAPAAPENPPPTGEEPANPDGHNADPAALDNNSEKLPPFVRGGFATLNAAYRK